MSMLLVLILPFFAVLLYAWERYDEYTNEQKLSAWEDEESARYNEENWPHEYRDALFWDSWHGFGDAIELIEFDERFDNQLA